MNILLRRSEAFGNIGSAAARGCGRRQTAQK